jgi:hypothetical protein
MKYAKRYQFSLRTALGILTAFCIVFGLMTALGVLPVAVMAVLLVGVGVGTFLAVWVLAERFGSPTPEKPVNPRVRKALLEWRTRQREVGSDRIDVSSATSRRGPSRH